MTEEGLIVGIDATNLRAGGGVVHLVEILQAADPMAHGIARVIVWGGRKTLSALEEQPWLVKKNPPALDGGVVQRTLWQRRELGPAATASQCDVLWVPGGTYTGEFHPVITMSQNLLPFQWGELRRFGFSATTLRLLLLRRSQSRTFRSADGVIFLTEFARDVVQRATGPLPCATAVVPHGITSAFRMPPKPQRPISEYSASRPYRLLYVSIINQYKHQWHVVEAVSRLRAEGLPVVLDLIGPAYPPALARLNATIDRLDPRRQWVHYQGAVPHGTLRDEYARADLGVFASSCETISIVLLETMASGLPVACSNREPLPEVLGDTGLYFDPEDPATIASTLRRYMTDPLLRREKAEASYQRAGEYSWKQCADRTFSFVASVAAGTRDSAAPRTT